MLLSFV